MQFMVGKQMPLGDLEAIGILLWWRQGYREDANINAVAMVQNHLGPTLKCIKDLAEQEIVRL